MPKLWNETIEAHRREVKDAILDTAAAMVFERGLRAVTMSQIAEGAGIGRATLYKYFPDVEAILRAWHERQVDAHLRRLVEAGAGAGDALERLRAVLAAYARIARETGSHDRELVRFLHPDAQHSHAHRQLHEMVRQLIDEGVGAGDLRGDVPSDVLAAYCLHALGAAAELASDEAVSQLVAVTVSGIRPTP